MGGLFLGLNGGLIICLASLAGGLWIFLKNRFSDFYDPESTQKLRLDFFLGLLLAITVSLSSPQKDLSISTASFFLGVALFFLIKNFSESLFNSSSEYQTHEEKSLETIFQFLLKNIPIGLSTGAIMNLSHSGEANSLLTIFAFYSFIQGSIIVFAFYKFGFEPILALTGILGCGLFAIAAGMSGGFVSQGNSHLSLLVMSFSGGALISSSLQETLRFVVKKGKNTYLKFILSPKLVNSLVVILLIAIWKELL